ncbi:hypothetical protein [Bacteroides graminisolvens]|uniref:hypothetical protein n=1 Tax=Bacteroides graminisolvens TaxID=477666 RepID=UPI0029C6BEC1|nr:hypothetical protein [Bacteroides graminisolvens]
MEDDFKELLLNRIYRDMKQTTTDKYYASLLLDRQILVSKCFNCLVSVFSVGGAAFSLVDVIIPMATGMIVGIFTIVKQFFPVIFMEPNDITKLNSIMTDYVVYGHRLQNIFDKLFTGVLATDEASKQYDELTTLYADKQMMLSKLFGKIRKKMNAKAALKSDNYLNEIYHNENK